MPSQLESLTAQVKDMVRTVIADPGIGDPELRRVLRFLTKVVQVVDQSFQDVLALLYEFKYVTVADVQTEKVSDLRKELDLLRARSRYRDAEEICSRLHH